MAEIDKFIVNNSTPATKTVEYFTILGEQDFLDNDQNPRLNSDDKALAKTIRVNDGIKKYYLKVGTYGKIYNPIGMYSEGKSEKFLSKIGRKEFEFREVNKQIFDSYITFLKTRNIAWLNNAERDMI